MTSKKDSRALYPGGGMGHGLLRWRAWHPGPVGLGGRPGSLGRNAHSLWVESLGYEPVLVILLGVGKYHWCMVFKEPRVVYSAVGRNVIWMIASSFGENLQTKVTSAALRSPLVLVLLVSLLRPSGQPRQSCLASSTCCCFFSTCSRIVSSNHLYPIPSSAN